MLQYFQTILSFCNQLFLNLRVLLLNKRGTVLEDTCKILVSVVCSHEFVCASLVECTLATMTLKTILMSL
jgi:hypothetical protein